MTDTQVTWLTQESHDRLKTELDQLIANRPVIAAEIGEITARRVWHPHRLRNALIDRSNILAEQPS